MAIVEMKHMDMLALEKDKHALLEAIQKLGCVQLLQADSEDVTFNKPTPITELPALDETLTRIGWAILRLSKYDKSKTPFMADKPTIDQTHAQSLLSQQERLLDAVATLEALEREAGDLRGQAARLDASRELLLPWQTLPVAPSEVHPTRSVYAALGTVQKTVLERLHAEGALGDLCTVEVISIQRDLAYVTVLCHMSVRDAVLGLLKEGNFSALHLPHSDLTVQAQLDAMATEQQRLDARQRGIVEDTASHVGELPALKQLYDVLASKRARLKAMEHFSESEHTFFLQSWVPAPLQDAITQELKRVSPSVALAFNSPDEGEEPPVILQNAPFFSPFETVVSSFSLPAPKSIDPTVVMMPFFINFMGMMVSDAGYGLMMAIIAPLLIKFLKPARGTRRMLWIIMAGGLMTVLWGALYNTWFGFAPWPSVFDPMNNAMPVMGACIGLGALHLFAGLGMAAYLNIRRGQWLDMVYDQLSWFLLIVGLGLLVVVPAVGQWMAIAGAAIIVAMAGRGKSNNPVKRLISGLGALYGVTGWVSDLLSYIRLFGMGLATGVIGMVINILVGMVAGGGIVGILLSAVVFVFGHLFNAGINIFGAYVHSCRLQYIEFFGKFFEDGGIPFRPLVHSSNYVHIGDMSV